VLKCILFYYQQIWYRLKLKIFPRKLNTLLYLVDLPVSGRVVFDTHRRAYFAILQARKFYNSLLTKLNLLWLRHFQLPVFVHLEIRLITYYCLLNLACKFSVISWQLPWAPIDFQIHFKDLLNVFYSAIKNWKILSRHNTCFNSFVRRIIFPH
jgi:hypothetical protein